MALIDSLPENVQLNDEAIARALVYSERSDSLLAENLFTCWKNGYYRLIGFRSIEEYLTKRWVGTDREWIGQVKASTVQRLIREYKLAVEIPELKAEFDNISRSNRFMICSVITKNNAKEWIEAAKTLSSKALAKKIKGLSDEEQPNKPVRMLFFVMPDQKAVIQQALDLAGKLIEQEGGDPNGKLGIKLELISADFISGQLNEINIL